MFNTKFQCISRLECSKYTQYPWFVKDSNACENTVYQNKFLLSLLYRYIPVSTTDTLMITILTDNSPKSMTKTSVLGKLTHSLMSKAHVT